MVGYKEMAAMKSDVIDLLNLSDGYDKDKQPILADRARKEALDLMVKYAKEKIENGDKLNADDNALTQKVCAQNIVTRDYWDKKIGK